MHVTPFSQAESQGSVAHVMRLFQLEGQLEKQLPAIKVHCLAPRTPASAPLFSISPGATPQFRAGPRVGSGGGSWIQADCVGSQESHTGVHRLLRDPWAKLLLERRGLTFITAPHVPNTMRNIFIDVVSFHAH